MRPDTEPTAVNPLASHVLAGETNDASPASCDYCGSGRLEWRKCKLICEDCKQINKSCADL